MNATLRFCLWLAAAAALAVYTAKVEPVSKWLGAGLLLSALVFLIDAAEALN